MDLASAGANGLRPAEGTVLLRKPNTTYNYRVYLFVLALFGNEHTTFVLALFLFLYSFHSFLIVNGSIPDRSNNSRCSKCGRQQFPHNSGSNRHVRCPSDRLHFANEICRVNPNKEIEPKQ